MDLSYTSSIVRTEATGKFEFTDQTTAARASSENCRCLRAHFG